MSALKFQLFNYYIVKMHLKTSYSGCIFITPATVVSLWATWSWHQEKVVVLRDVISESAIHLICTPDDAPCSYGQAFTIPCLSTMTIAKARQGQRLYPQFIKHIATVSSGKSVVTLCWTTTLHCLVPIYSITPIVALHEMPLRNLTLFHKIKTPLATSSSANDERHEDFAKSSESLLI